MSTVLCTVSVIALNVFPQVYLDVCVYSLACAAYMLLFPVLANKARRDSGCGSGWKLCLPYENNNNNSKSYFTECLCLPSHR